MSVYDGMIRRETHCPKCGKALEKHPLGHEACSGCHKTMESCDCHPDKDYGKIP
jgi:predicted amidophosphoribosyltransferase